HTEPLRMQPRRNIVRQVREAESLDILIALSSGLPGIAAINTSYARGAVTKLCTLQLLAGENVSRRCVVPTVASSIDLVVHLDSFSDGRRRVREIVGLSGRVEDEVIEVSDVFSLQGDRLARGDGHPPHADRFARAGHDLSALLGRAAA